jgi:electron transport complex protein RnfC
MKVYSFPHGGIQFDDPTAPSRESTTIAFLPCFSVIPIIQYTENRVDPVVSVGDTVYEGMLIGKRQGVGTANVHATVPGRVVRAVSWQVESHTNEALVIRMEGRFDKLGRPKQVFPWNKLYPEELQQIITDYGIVEMEGTGMPLIDVLNALPARTDNNPLTVVVRCVFDDPWLAADYAVCRERLKAVIEGALILQKAAGAAQIVYAISHKDKKLADAFRTEVGSFEVPAFFAMVSSLYPQRNRRELELVLRDFEKKENLHLGHLLVQGPSTLAALYDAVKLHHPILDRYVAVGGSAVRRPSVLKVRIGTMFEEVFASCGGFSDEPARVATGSPIMGRRVSNLDEPITKTTTAVFALLKKQVGSTAIRSCISCGECQSVCPVELDPERLYKAIKGLQPGRVIGKIAECHGCGCCELVCPSRLPLSTTISTWNHHQEPV